MMKSGLDLAGDAVTGALGNGTHTNGTVISCVTEYTPGVLRGICENPKLTFIVGVSVVGGLAIAAVASGALNIGCCLFSKCAKEANQRKGYNEGFADKDGALTSRLGDKQTLSPDGNALVFNDRPTQS